MSSTINPVPRRQGDLVQQSLGCRLRPTEHHGRQGLVPYMGELELVNQSDATIEIEHQMSPLQYLDLVISDADGRIVSQGHFADRFSPSLESSVLRLPPGERYVATVPLLGTLPRERRSEGIYVVQAVYEYSGLRAVSAAVSVEVKGAAK